MTVSSPPAPEPTPLASLFTLLGGAALLAWKRKAVLLGYAAWTLIPILLLLGAEEITPGLWHDIASGAIEALDFLLIIWVEVVMIIYVTLSAGGREVKNERLTAIGLLAWQTTPTVLGIVLLAGILELAGLALFIVPGLVLITWFAFGHIVAIVEGRSIIASLKESRQLVRGRFWAVFGRLFGGFAIITVTYIILALFAVWLVGALTGQGSDLLTAPSPWWTAAVSGLVRLPFLPLFVLFPYVLYTELLPEKSNEKPSAPQTALESQPTPAAE